MQRFLKISKRLESIHLLSLFISINNVSDASFISFYARHFVLDRCDKISIICISIWMDSVPESYCFLPDGRIASNGKRKRVNDFNLSRYNTFTVNPVTLSSLSILLSLRFLFVSDDDSRFVWLSQSRKSSFRRNCAPRERIPCFYASTFLIRRESREGWCLKI